MGWLGWMAGVKFMMHQVDHIYIYITSTMNVDKRTNQLEKRYSSPDANHGAGIRIPT